MVKVFRGASEVKVSFREERRNRKLSEFMKKEGEGE